jgi:hypothetical protein
VAPQLALAGVSLDSGSRGTRLTDADIRALVSNAIQNNTFPADANGIYAVILARTDVTQSASFGSLCDTYCGYHSTMNVNGVDIKFVFDGAGNVAGGNCEKCRDAYEPNGTWADAVVNTLSHEIAETVTDPDLNAWGSGASNDEVGDKCNFNFSERHNDPNAFPATAKVGRRYYDIQQLWSPVAGGKCLSGYSSPPTVLFQANAGGPIADARPIHQHSCRTDQSSRW